MRKEDLPNGTKITLDYSKVDTYVPYTFPRHMAEYLMAQEKVLGYLIIKAKVDGAHGVYYRVKINDYSIPLDVFSPREGYMIPPEIILKIVSDYQRVCIYEEGK